MSAAYCGCDAEALPKAYTCKLHTDWPLKVAPLPVDTTPGQHVDGWKGETVEPMPVTGRTTFRFADTNKAAVAQGPAWNMDVQEAPEPTIGERLRQEFPHGHPQFLPITLKEMELHSAKNHDYAKGGSPLGNFERVAAILALYPNLKLSDQRVVALVYAMKQLDAVLWGLNSNIEHKVEGLASRLQDISVYAKIVMCMLEDK